MFTTFESNQLIKSIQTYPVNSSRNSPIWNTFFIFILKHLKRSGLSKLIRNHRYCETLKKPVRIFGTHMKLLTNVEYVIDCYNLYLKEEKYQEKFKASEYLIMYFKGLISKMISLNSFFKLLALIRMEIYQNLRLDRFNSTPSCFFRWEKVTQKKKNSKIH